MSIRDRSEPRDGYAVRVLAVHTSEGIDKPVVDDAAALRDASWWEGSSHAIADNDPGSLLTPAEGCVPYDRASWTLRSGNRWSENIELIAQAGWTRAQWLARPTLLDRCAFWLAARSKVDRGGGRRIPLVKITAAQYRAGAWGVIGHHDHTVGYSDGTHWDPGPGFPWDVVLDKARAYAAGLTPGGFLMALTDAQQEAAAREINAIWRRSEGFLRQRYYVVENGAKREVAADHAGAIPAAALDTLDGDYLVRLIQSAATKAIVDAAAKLPSSAVAADVDEEALAELLAPKLTGTTKDDVADALRQVLRDGVGA